MDEKNQKFKEAVEQEYSKQNYKIIYTENNLEEKYAVIYFTGNGIYAFPTFECLEENILKKDRYEWEKRLFKKAQKHILLRDLHKAWYIKGINSEINDVDKVIEFLKKETEGYKVITIGSSAGGYMAMLAGSVLEAEYVIAFVGQFILKDRRARLEAVRSKDNQRIFGDLMSLAKYKDITPIIKEKNIPIFYFTAALSKKDAQDIAIAKTLDNIYIFPFKSAVHGIHSFIRWGIPKLNKEELLNWHSTIKSKSISIVLTNFKLLGMYALVQMIKHPKRYLKQLLLELFNINLFKEDAYL